MFSSITVILLLSLWSYSFRKVGSTPRPKPRFGVLPGASAWTLGGAGSERLAVWVGGLLGMFLWVETVGSEM